MTISTGEQLPDMAVTLATANGPQPSTTAALFADKKTAFFAVPGAFTPTCSAQHLPGFLAQKEALMQRGIEQIVCMSVNDPFVMQAWAERHHATGEIMMLADGNGSLAQALGLMFDGHDFSLGQRAQRFSMIVQDGKVEVLNIEEGGTFEVSSAEYMLAQL